MEVRGSEDKENIRLDERTRNQLRIDCNRHYSFVLRPVGLPGQLRWAMAASDSAVRIAAMMGFLGLATGFAGLVVSVVSVFWQPGNDNGRYVFQHQQATANAAETITVFDTRTGTLFGAITSKDAQGHDVACWVEIHPATGITITRKLKPLSSN